MYQVRRILFPTDFSDAAEAALDHALLLAGALSAELHLLHVHVLLENDPENPELRASDPSTATARLDELAKRRQRGLESREPDLDVTVVHAEERGYSAPGAILDYADEHGVDLVVMGSHGRRGIGRWLLGSVASQVVHHAPCPVLVVRAGVRAKARPVESILVPTDFSDSSRAALTAVRELAGALGARIVLLHAVDFPTYPAFYSEAMFPPSLTEELEVAARDRLAELWEEAGGPDVPHRLELHAGRAVSCIRRIAAERDCDWIAMAPRGLGATERFVFGSTTEALLRSAERPLLVLGGLEEREPKRSE